MKKRKKIVFILFILFFLITPVIIFYVQGYRINFNPSTGTKIITKTGGFYFNIIPKNVEIYINNRLKAKTNFFSNDVFLKNYLPKKYKIEIKKNGFHSWEKNLEVKEKHVTEIKNVVLIPENPNFLFLMKDIKNYFFSPNGKEMIVEEVLTNNQKLYLYNINNNTKNDLINEKNILKDILGENINLIDLKFSNDSKKILIKTKLDKKNKYYFFLIDLEKSSDVFYVYEGSNDDGQEIFFNPENFQKFFILEKNNLFEKDLKEKTKIKFLEKIIAFLISGKDIYYLDDSGFVFKTDSSFQIKEKINEKPFPLQKEQKYKINIFSGEIFIQDKNNLYLFNSNTETFEKFFENYKEIKISPDFKKIVYFSDYEIWVMYLTEIQEQPSKMKKEKTFITRVSKEIGDVFWLTDHYLIFNSGDEIKITEIDDRDKINIIDLAKYKSPKIYWNRIYKKLFLLSENNLYNLKILVR